MADAEIRAAQRDPDPEDLAHHQRRRCRVGRHTWRHYKGGEDYVCSACGATKEAEERELGAQTLFLDKVGGFDPHELMDELQPGEDPPWLAEPGPNQGAPGP